MWDLLDLPAHFESLASRLRPWRLWIELTAWISMAALAAVAIRFQPSVITRASGALLVAMAAVCLWSWWLMMTERMFGAESAGSWTRRNRIARWCFGLFLALIGVVSVIMLWKVSWLFGLV